MTAALFVGGESRRMGTDKAAIIVSGRPLWSRQLEILSELKPERVLVSARMHPRWCPSTIDVILDEPPSIGPLSGLVAVLRQIKTSHLLILAIDLPQMTTTHLRNLWMMAKPSMGVIPKNGELFEPLGAIYPTETMTIAQDHLANEQFSLQTLANKLLKRNLASAYFLSNFEDPLYRNVNTPQDLACLN